MGKKDTIGRLFKLLRNIILLFNSFLFSQFNYFICFVKKIKIDQNCKFYGSPYFYRHPHSSILIGKGCTFRSGTTSNLIGINIRCIISTNNQSAKIIIGNNCGFSGTVIGCFDIIKIGNNVRCGANTLITDSDWHSDDPRTGPPKEVILSDNVWLGVNVVVLKGVTIGKNTIIGANSVVVKDIPENVIAAGNPCRVIKSL